MAFWKAFCREGIPWQGAVMEKDLSLDATTKASDSGGTWKSSPQMTKVDRQILVA